MILFLYISLSFSSWGEIKIVVVLMNVFNCTVILASKRLMLTFLRSYLLWKFNNKRWNVFPQMVAFLNWKIAGFCMVQMIKECHEGKSICIIIFTRSGAVCTHICSVCHRAQPVSCHTGVSNPCCCCRRRYDTAGDETLQTWSPLSDPPCSLA